MKFLLWAIIILYVFGFGFYFVRKLGKFFHGNHRAFPGCWRRIVVSPPKWKKTWDDSASLMCCHAETNGKELQGDEKCDP